LKIYIKYMVSPRCKAVVKDELKKLGLHFVFADLGVVDIMESLSEDQLYQLKNALLSSGLELMDDKKALLIEKIKKVIIEMVHYVDDMPKVNLSDYLSKHLNYDYTYMAGLFSEVQGITLEKYLIVYKIEKVKELIIYDQLSLSEIAWKMHYSSVAHLSNQFKKITGLTPSHFKSLKEKREKTIDSV
jgi:YesN/AraC family two-component response regulator